MHARRFDELLLGLYACASERQRWPGVLDWIGAEVHARSAVIQIIVPTEHHSRSILTLRDSLSDSERAEHERYMGDDVNPRMRVHVSLRPGQYALRNRDFFSADEAGFAELKERVAAIGLGPFMSVSAPLPGGERVALVLHRDSNDDREFDADEESFARALAPHLRQVLCFDARLRASESRAHELEAAIHQMRCGLVLCESDARVCWANPAAETLFARRDAVWPCAERLKASSATDTVTLRKMIADVAQNDRGTAERILVLGRNSTTEPLQLMMQPVSAPNHTTACGAARSGRVLVMLSSPHATPALPATLIERLFALSPAESRLTAALCRGQTVEDYARAAGVTLGTARFQLKQVLAKTQVPRQSELVRKVCSSVIAHVLPRVS